MTQARPNVVIFVTDDQGYGDLSCMGCTDFRTPAFDRMAAQGIRMTDFYANASVCSPSRAALLTGRHPERAGVQGILAGHRTATGMPPSVPTLARALRDEGYQTFMAGKWHLGVDESSRPHNHGFDHWFGFLAGCIDYYSHIFYYAMGSGQNPVHDLWEDGEEIYDDGRYMTEAITDKALDYIRQAVREDRPFFLYVPYNAPHYPMHAPQRYKDRFPDMSWDRQIMAAMLAAVDDGVGQIHDELERQGVLENTISFTMSDNGPSRERRNWLDGTEDHYYGGTTGKLRGQKFTLYEGGIRVPGIIRWPAGLPSGQVLNTPIAAHDIFPTILEAVGGDPSKYDLDGISVLAQLRGEAPAPQRDLCWQQADQLAVRRGPWKLVINGREAEQEQPVQSVHLANLDRDLGEQNNLAEAEPELTRELTEVAREHSRRVLEYYEQHFADQPSGLATHS